MAYVVSLNTVHSGESTRNVSIREGSRGALTRLEALEAIALAPRGGAAIVRSGPSEKEYEEH